MSAPGFPFLVMGLTGDGSPSSGGHGCASPLFAGLLQRFQALMFLVETVPQALAPVALICS